MTYNNIFKKSISALLIIAGLIGNVPAFAQNEKDESAVLFKEDYQSVALGGIPTYGASNWSGDTSATHGECVIGVVDENGNKSFRMQYTGEGKSVTADPLVYRNIVVPKGEVHTFTIRMKTDDTNQYKQLFLRSSNGEKIELFGFNGSKVLTVGSATAALKKGKWYEVRVVLDGTKKMADVYVDGVYGGSRYLNKYDMTSMSIRVTMLGATLKGAVTNVYIDNAAYAQKNMKIEFEQPEYVQENPVPEVDTENAGNTSSSVSKEEIQEVKNENLSVFSIDNTKAYIRGEYKDTGIKTTVYRGNTVLPLVNIAEACNTEVYWNNEQNCAQINIDGRDIRVSEEYITIDGVMQELIIKPVMISERLYVDTMAAELISGKTIVADMSGAVSVYTEHPKDGEVSAILDKIAFTEPSPEEILADFESYNPNNSHPRILMDKNRLERIRYYIKNDKTFAKWYEPVKIKADKALNAPISTYELRDGERLLYVSREAHDSIVYPAFAYLISGERKYFERAVAEMMAVSEFADWHPLHFLDTAEMTLGVAIGYDWLYDTLNKKQKEKISTAILRLGLDAANEAYEGTAEYPTNVFGSYHNRIGWKDDNSNWGLVCNGGIAAGALAIMGDVETEYCAEIVSKALKGIKRPMKMFAPDGAWTEGIGYWSYACNYMAYMLSSIKNTVGTNYDYTMVPGMLSTANYPIYHIGPKGTFNYGDATESGMSAPVLFWFASELGEPALNDAKFGLMEKFGYNGELFDILFYEPNLPAANSEVEKDKKFRIAETAIMTNSSASTNANYFAIKGGTVGVSHGDLDAGSFILDSMGERWVVDLGSDSYTLPGYFEWPKRGDYYRKRAEGHSTLVINPDGGLDQKLGGQAEITHMLSDTYGACTVLDMSTVYSDDAESVRRAAVMFDNRSKFMIQDEVVCEKPSDVYWFMQTGKNIEIAEDGKSLILTDKNTMEHGKRIKLILQSTDKNAVFTYTPAEPLEISPQGVGQTKNNSVSRIQVKSSNVTNLNMQVIFVPYIVAESGIEINLPELGTIDDLIYQKNIEFGKQTYATLDNLTVDGETINFFDPTVKYYTAVFESDYNKVPEINADSAYDVEITQPDSLAGMAKIKVTDKTGNLKEQTYFVSFAKERLTDRADVAQKEIGIEGVEASAIAEANNTPENTIDGDMETKWSANGSQWIKYDLGSVKNIGCVGIQWLTPTSRTQRYSLELSEDGESWTQLFSGMSLGTTEGMEYVVTDGFEARYVRISVNGTTAGNWSSLMETKVYE